MWVGPKTLCPTGSWVLLMKENEGPKSCTTVPLTSRGEVEPDRSWDVMKLFLRELELWRSILEAQQHLCEVKKIRRSGGFPPCLHRTSGHLGRQSMLKNLLFLKLFMLNFYLFYFL
jgi:hypothetical protein